MQTMRSSSTVATILSILLFNSQCHESYASDPSNFNDDVRNPLANSTASSYPAAILNGIHNATVKIVLTSPIGSIPPKTWISFDDGPMVEIDDELTLESIEAAYNRTMGKHGQASGLLEPFSFESPFADPICVFNGTVVKATITGPSTISCVSPTIDRTQGAGVPMRISSNGGHDLTSLDVFVYLSSQDRGTLLLEPNHGPSSGGTRVHVKGITSGAIVDGPRALCKFGNHISHAIEVGSRGEFVVCISPPRSVNEYVVTVPVDVSMLGQSSVFSGEKVVFRYDEDISVSSLSPSSGVVIGGTQVNIHGGPFQNPDEIVCRFGEKTVDAIYHDMTAISCISPNLGWIEEVQRVSIFTMAVNPEIQTISATVEDYVNEIHICQTFGKNLDDDEFGRGFRLVAPGGSIEYPLTHHTRWIHYNESADGMREALLGTGLFIGGTHVDRTGPFLGETYKWEIVLPKNETFDGETLHVVNSGGGAVRLKGANASVSCILAQKGTHRLRGEFRLLSSNNGLVETTRLIPHNATNDDIKTALEELRGVDVVHVQSTNLDINMTGSGAVQWHVTFDSLKNAGDLPLLTVEHNLFGSNVSVGVKETRKGASHAIYKIEFPPQIEKFSIMMDGIESRFLLVGATSSEVEEAVRAIGGKSVVVKKYEADYFFLDIIGYPLEGRLKAHLIQCVIDNTSPSCSSVLLDAVLHVPSTTNQLGGHFSLQFQPKLVSCETCMHSTTGPISAFATAEQIEEALHGLDFVDDVAVVITESDRHGEYKVPVTSGIVGMNRNIYIRFIQNKARPLVIDGNLALYSTQYSGDVPMLVINQSNLKGSPTRESAHSNDYVALVTEVVKGTDLNHGGIVEVAVSINNGADFTERNPNFEYKPVPIVQNIIPGYGSIAGNTAIHVRGDNFSRNSARFCLFWGLDATIEDRVPLGLIEYVPISKYVTDAIHKTQLDNSTIVEVVCMSPAVIKPQYANIAVVSDNDILSLESSIPDRGKLFRYHHEIKISNIYPASASVAGNISVTVSGGPFFSSEGLFCAFGQAIVPGVLHSPKQISCHAPMHASGTYSLEVTQNGQDFTKSWHTFRYFHSCTVSSISPMSGPARRAGTNVKVTGENFVNSTDLQCRFGVSIVPATFFRSTEISCSSPPIESSSLTFVHLAGYYPQSLSGHLVSLEVSNNGQDFTPTGRQFLYMEDIEEPHVAMRELHIFGVGTPTIIRGNNFVNSTELSCRFRNDIVRAVFLNREAVLCFSPPGYGQNYLFSNTEKSIPLSVSNNAVDFVHVAGLNSTSKISGGMYQAGKEVNSLLSCPRGAYCDGSLLVHNFTLCNPGTYQPMAGQSSCVKCPIGYVCNEFGMTVPRICPAYYLCDVRGLAKAKPCPTNYICDRGTATLASACVNSKDVGSEICFDNSTDDFGLQSSEYPAQVWAERHLLPLDAGSPVTPIRGRYCFDIACINHEDSDNFQVFDKSFDYSSTGYRLRRPKCIEGTDCDSVMLPSSRLCSKGHYCNLGLKHPCGVGTYCPHDNLFDPLPCEPGTFNFMVGQDKCSDCPIGYYCPKYGLLSPVICPPGFACSRIGLRSPNIRCPAGFYCLNGTKTSDPFRNDTTLRPYACSAGTFCVAGTGSNEIREDVIGYAQPCAAGFFCEAASTSAKGSGACPPSFQCPKGTANPRPTPKGYHAEHPGTIESTACLPGFYAPTIQTEQCYECPPGTSCTFEGLFQAEVCGPGTHRSTGEEGGKSCVPCPHGTWSKNWGLRDQAECTRCPTGTVCPIDGMTQPCSYADLPTPFEPVVNFQGFPEFEYLFPADSRPLPFSLDECLGLNSVRENSTAPQFFFGELIPPYIDILGRGPHFRPSDQNSLKFQSTAKCYRNNQPHGSLLYMRMAEYYGPQYDIQTGHRHQGYGINFLYNQIYATAPPKGYDFSFNYFRGEGNGYIDLPKARIYDPAFNCTKGIKLMNSSLVIEGAKQIVYTDSTNDFEGGYDLKKCPYFDSKSSCFVADSFAAGGCCNISKYEQRAIYLAHDQFYIGTCEADLICSEGGLAPSQAKPCDAGFVCDERSTLEGSRNFPCPAGFVCDFATTPDTNIWAPGSQLNRLCKEGYYCKSHDLGRQRQEICPKDFWCPSGTSDPLIGLLANDGLLRLLHRSRESPSTYLQYHGGDIFVLGNDHDNGCVAATLPSLEMRFQSLMHENTNVNRLSYLSDQSKLSIAVSEAALHKDQCARDNKSALVRDAMRRNECNCHSQFLILASVYRLWKCTANSPLEDLGLGDTVVPPSGLGKRDFWHPNSRIHLDFGSTEREKKCVFNDSIDALTLTEGKLPDEDELPNISTLQKHYSNYLDLRRRNSFETRFARSSTVIGSYEELKHKVIAEFHLQRKQTSGGVRGNIDQETFDLYQSIKLIEQFGQRLEHFIYLNATNTSSVTSIDLAAWNTNNYSTMFDFVAPLDWCECQNLLRCPNGTSSNEGSNNLSDCVSTKNEVLHRIPLLPSVYNATTLLPSTVRGTVDESTALVLEPFEVAILTIDQSQMPTNMTYGDHYQISIYDGCKPCPIQYQCKMSGGVVRAETSECTSPSVPEQHDLFNDCLKQHRKNVCVNVDGTQEDVGVCQNRNATLNNHSFLIFSEPDMEKCLSRQYFCTDMTSNFLSFRRLCQDKQENGNVSPVYDCSDVSRWQIYSQWRDKVCCSHVPELRGIESCSKGSVCTENPLIEKIIRERLIGVFESEYGFNPPTEQRQGQLLMNTSLQEDMGNTHPIHLFNKGENEKGRSKNWKTSPGCCRCHRHEMPSFFESNAHVSGFPDDKHQPIQVTISALARVELTIVIELLNGAYYTDFRNYFGEFNKSLVRVHSPGRSNDASEALSTWMAVLQPFSSNEKNFDLPLNLPLAGVKHGKSIVENRFLVDRPSNVSIGDDRLFGITTMGFDPQRSHNILFSRNPKMDPIEKVLQEKQSWPHDFLALPYLPFFSNCDGYDSHIAISRLLEEHPDCSGVEYSQTVPISDFGPMNPVGDSCLGIVLHCTYEEEVRGARTNLRWFEAASGSTIFHITRDAVSSRKFVPSGEGKEWGRSIALEDIRSQGLIPVSLDKEFGGLRHSLPRKIFLEMKYFQVSRGHKRLVEAKLYFDELCTTQPPDHIGGSTKIADIMQERGILPCDVDVNGNIKSQGYDLVVSFTPLGWFDLLNRFELGASVYAVLFAVVGSTVCFMGGLVFGINRILTKIRYPPKFKGLSLVKLVSLPQIQGVVLAMIPHVAAIMSTCYLFSDSALTFPGVHRSWSRWGRVEDGEKIENSMGRLGSALIVLGIYSISRATMILIPTTRVRRVETVSEVVSDSRNVAAKRAHFVGICLAVECMLLCLWEFSYSAAFRNNIYLFKLIFQLCQVLLDQALISIMGDRLLAAPILVSIQMAELLVTVGARNFVEFTLSFLVESTLSVVQRLFLYPLVYRMSILLPRWKLLAREALRLNGVSEHDTQQKEFAMKKINEDIELRSKGVEPLLFSLSMYTVEKTGVMLLPFMHFLLGLLYTESEIAKSYNINQKELLYYGLFAVFLIPWMSVFDSFILSSLELLFGWKIYDYFSYQRLRFASRENCWNLLAPVDESVVRSLQNVDLLCFSSQYYFLLSIIALGFGINMMGITICLRREYSPLSDPTLLLVVIIVVACCELIVQLCVVVSASGVWNVSQLEGTMDDVVSSKLTIGEGRQVDIEREKQELQAINSPSFRHKFMEKNRPWVLQHLVELFTPGTFPVNGPDGRPICDFVRDVYANLIHDGQGTERHEGDDEISSNDSSDEDEVRRRRWDHTPVEGNQRLIAQSWIQKARKQCVFRQVVAPIIEKRKEDNCSSCSRSLEQCESLTAGLACSGRFDQAAIDVLMKSFEESYSRTECSQILWKAFFLENARFSTICNVCLEKIEQEKLRKQLRPVVSGVSSLPEDISSDEESVDERFFAPVSVPRSSAQGEMIVKWLHASRARLRGESSTVGAIETEGYLEEITNRKSIKEARAGTQSWGRIDLSEMEGCIIKRWYNSAQQNSLARFNLQAEKIRTQLLNALDSLDVEDDWVLGELRLNGKALKIEGHQIAKRKERNESQIKLELETLGLKFSLTKNDIVQRKTTKRMEFETALSQLKTDSLRTKDIRSLDLNTEIDDLKQSDNCNEKEMEALKSTLKTELEDLDALTQSKVSELTSQFEDQMKVLDREFQSTSQAYERNCQLLTDRVQKEYVIQEREWQRNASVWLEKASRARS